MLQTENYKIKQYSDTPLEDFLKDYAQDRETFPVPDAPKNDTTENADTAEPGGDDKVPEGQTPATEAKLIKPELSEKEIRGKREFTANLFAKNTDRAMAFLLAMAADSDDVDEWKASPDDVKDIYTCYYEMMQSYGWGGMPPWANLLICIALTYGPVFLEARKVRGINHELAAQAARDRAEKLIQQKRADQLEAEKKDAETPATEKPKVEPSTQEIKPE